MAGGKQKSGKSGKKGKQRAQGKRLAAEEAVRRWAMEGLFCSTVLSKKEIASFPSSSCFSSDEEDELGEREREEGGVAEWGRMPREESAPVLVDLHSHSTCSDGRLGPRELVALAAQQGVRVLALTDHDTMAGVATALAAGIEFGVRVIPGVEISALASYGEDAKPKMQSVHILGYYGRGGPCRGEELSASLARICKGRFARAEAMVEKLKMLGVTINFDRVLELAGVKGAPGRPHIAQALVEAGYVATAQEAFSRYLFDDGPVSSKGAEISAEEAVQLVCRTGGISVLAHPWCLKSPEKLVARLKFAGLHGLEAHRDPAKLAYYGPLAEEHGLLQLGGSDYHGTGNRNEVQLGGNSLPTGSMQRFLKVAKEVWKNALEEQIESFRPALQGRAGGVRGGAKAGEEVGEEKAMEGCDGGSLGVRWEGGPLEDGQLQLSEWMVKEDRVIARRKAEQVGLSCTSHRSGWGKVLVLSDDTDG